MRANVVLIEDISLDGIMDNPQDMLARYKRGPEGDKFKLDELAEADAILLGRTTYAAFAGHWPTSKEPFAERINQLPKYVVSGTMTETSWQNSHILPDLKPDRVAKLKQSHTRNILIYGSTSVAHLLLKQGLIDELHLMIYPMLVGRGKRALPDGVSAELGLTE